MARWTAASDAGLATSTLRVVSAERSSDIVMGDRPIMSVYEADAEAPERALPPRRGWAIGHVLDHGLISRSRAS